MESCLMASRFKKWKMGKRDFLLLTTFFNKAPKYTKAAVTAVVGIAVEESACLVR